MASLLGDSGLDLPIASSADTIALVVLVALIVRYLGEALAVRVYPGRLGRVPPEDMPKPSTREMLGDRIDDLATLLVTAFVVSSIPGLVASLLDLVAREAPEPEIGWTGRTITSELS